MADDNPMALLSRTLDGNKNNLMLARVL